MATTKEKKEIVRSSLKLLRSELRQMHLTVTEQLTLPDPSDVKELMDKMEKLLEVVEAKTTRKPKTTKED
tara:strand:- start:7982 stop:8191 length:210 start_codon:yes stop_codon:yes gene_type:complete